MKRIDRYLLSSLATPFFFSLFTILFVLVLQFFATFADRFIGKGITLWLIAKLILLQSAWMVGLAAPMAALVAAVMTFGSLTNSSEMTVFRATGISLYRLMLPVVGAGLFLSLCVERFNNVVLPEANHYARSMMLDIARSKPVFGLAEHAFSTLVDGYFILVRKYDDVSRELRGIVIYDTTRPEYRTVATAEKGRVSFSADDRYLVLTLENGEIQQIGNPEFRTSRRLRFKRHRVLFASSGFGFSRSSGDGERKADSELSASELHDVARHYRELSAVGGSLGKGRSANQQGGNGEADRQQYRLIADKYLAAYHKKYALSFACLVFVLVGAPLGIFARRGGFGAGAVLSLLVFVGYWLLMIAGERLAERGIVEPWIAIWMANILTAGTGAGLLVFLTGARFGTSR